MNRILKAIVVSGISVVSANAATIFSTDFTSAEGYTENGEINGKQNWSSQTVVPTLNVATNGEVQYTSNSFLRSLNANTAFAVGQTMTITTSVRTIGGNSPSFDANLFRIGITNNTNLGTSFPQVGSGLGGSGTLFRVATEAYTSRIDGITIDTVYHTFTSTITKSATANQFNVTTNFAGTSFSHTVTDAGLYNAATVFFIMQSAAVTNVGGFAVDSVNVDLVPEPSVALLSGLGVLALLRRRRA